MKKLNVAILRKLPHDMLLLDMDNLREVEQSNEKKYSSAFPVRWQFCFFHVFHCKRGRIIASMFFKIVSLIITFQKKTHLTPPFRYSIHCRSKGSPLYYFEILIFGWSKTFLKAPSAPKYTDFEGGTRPEKTRFLVKTFHKWLKTLFWPFFNNLPAAQKIWWEWGLYSNFGEL